MNIISYYLAEADEYIKLYRDIPLSDAFFEGTREIREINKNNEEVSKSVINSIKNAISKLIQIVRDMIKKIKNWFSTMSLSPSEKQKYEEIKRLIKSNPIYGNITVNVQNYEDYEYIYNKALKQIEDAERKVENGDLSHEEVMNMSSTIEDDLRNRLNLLSKQLNTYGNKALATVTLRTLVDIADNNKICAMMISKELENESSILSDIEKELGKTEAIKFKKKITRINNRGVLHNLKVKILHKKQKTLTDIMYKQANLLIKNVKKAFKPSYSTKRKAVKQVRKINKDVGDFIDFISI